MRVLHGSCFLEYSYGGAEQVTRQLIPLLGSHSESVAVCLGGGVVSCDESAVIRLSAPVGERSRFGQAYKRYVLFLQNRWQQHRWLCELRQKIDLEQFDIVHCHDTFWLNLFAAVAREFNKPLIFTCHQNLPVRLILRPLLKPLESAVNWNLRRSDSALRRSILQCWRAVTPSAFCADCLRRFTADGCPPVTVIHNWVEDYLLGSTADQVAGRPGTLVYVGRLSEEKGVRLLLDATRGMPDVKLSIVGGNGPLVQKVRKRKDITWVKSVPHPQIVDFIKHFEVAVCPSLVDESFGKTALEYRLAGVKIVATRSGAVPEILLDYPNVFWAEANAQDLRAKLLEALQAPRNYENGSAISDFISRFSAEHARSAYEALYLLVAEANASS